MKDQIGQQLQGQFGEPVKQMVSDLVKQLKDQLGEEEEFTTIEDVEPVIQISSTGSSIQEIDLMLLNPDLSEDQINELLDRRAELL